MNRSRLIRFFFPAVIIVSVVFMINLYLRSEGGVEIGFWGGDYSTFIGTTVFFLAIAAFAQIMIRRGSRGRYDKMNAYLSAERAANTARKRDIDDSLIIKAAFPQEACIDSASDDALLLQKQEKARAASHAMMMRTGLSNIEIKHAFGPQNIDHIAQCEANFNNYVKALQEWAEELLNRGNKDAARLVLEEAVNAGAETSKAFITLTGLYRENRRRADIEALLVKTQNPVFLASDPVTKSKIQSHISDTISQLNSGGLNGGL